MKTATVAFALALISSFVVAPAFAIEGVPSVIDGDTLDIRGQRIRLFGIDAPEGRQTCQRDGKAWRCGQQAALALSDKIARRSVKCEQRDRDRYRRIVAVCFLNGEDLNGWMVREGWAVDYRRYSKGRYAGAEAEARADKRGIWSGKFEKPWAWRKRKKYR